MTAKEMKEHGYYELFGTVYKLFQNADTSDWARIVQDADCICNKYKDTPLRSFCNDMVKSIVDELERRDK